MGPVSECAVPQGSLLEAHVRRGSYADCFQAETAGSISHAQYVEAFYTTPLFKLERLLLSWVLSAPSTDPEARELALAKRESFSAWRVEARGQDELLVATGRTRSWFMVKPSSGGTRLYFGTAVVPKGRRHGAAGLDFGFRALLGFHRAYSRALLHSARVRLDRVG